MSLSLTVLLQPCSVRHPPPSTLSCTASCCPPSGTVSPSSAGGWEEPDGAETGEKPFTLRLPGSRVSQEITEAEEVKEITENTIVTCNCGVCIIDVDIGLRVIGNKQTIYTSHSPDLFKY